MLFRNHLTISIIYLLKFSILTTKDVPYYGEHLEFISLEFDIWPYQICWNLALQLDIGLMKLFQIHCYANTGLCLIMSF